MFFRRIIKGDKRHSKVPNNRIIRHIIFDGLKQKASAHLFNLLNWKCYFDRTKVPLASIELNFHKGDIFLQHCT